MKVRALLRAAFRDEWDGLERINRDLRLADLFTILNAMMGLSALWFAAQGEVVTAFHFVLVGIILDGVDGAVARLGKGDGPLGGPLDSLADGVTFVATPAMIALTWVGPLDGGLDLWIARLAIGLYFAGGLLRLARFEAIRDDKPRRYFSGLPTPAGALVLLAALRIGVSKWLFVAAAVYTALLMVSRFRFPKLRGWLGIAAASAILAILISARDPTLQEHITLGLLGFMAAYVFFGPLYVLARAGPVRDVS